MQNPSVIIYMNLLALLISACGPGRTESTSDQAVSDSTVASIHFEIVNQQSNPLNLDVYIEDTSRISILNAYFVKKYKTPESIGILINYFSNRKIAKIYFDKINKVSEKESNALFKYYIAVYNYNPGSGYDSLAFMHSK